MNLLTAAPYMGGCLLSTAYVLQFIDRVMQILILKPQMTLIIHCNRTNGGNIAVVGACGSAECDVANNVDNIGDGEDEHENKRDDDIYIMMKCVFVCNEKSSLPPVSLL